MIPFLENSITLNKSEIERQKFERSKGAHVVIVEVVLCEVSGILGCPVSKVC